MEDEDNNNGWSKTFDRMFADQDARQKAELAALEEGRPAQLKKIPLMGNVELLDFYLHCLGRNNIMFHGMRASEIWSEMAEVTRFEIVQRMGASA